MTRTAAAFLALALVAAPAAAGPRELIRFREADGTLGLVDDPDKLPPGATVIERQPLPPVSTPSQVAPPPSDDAAPPADEPTAPDEAPAAGSRPATAHPGDADRCVRFGLSPRCGAEAAEAEDWCRRAGDLHEARQQAERNRDRAQASFEQCQMSAGAEPYCSRRRLDAAEHAVEDADAKLDRLEQECRNAECLPGWVREGCGRE